MRPLNGVRTALEAGVAHHRAGRKTQAEDAYRAVLKQRPGQPDALHLLGVLATEAGDPVRGAELIRRALAATPANADAHSNLGNALRASGRLADATQSYLRAVKLHPAHVAAHTNLGVTFADLGEHGQAIASFMRALALDGDGLEARRGLARSHRARGELAQAEAAYRRARVPRASPELTVELATLLIDADRPEEALALFEEAEAIRPAGAAVLLARGRCEYRLGEVAQAVRSYRRALDVDPTAAPVWNDLGRALRATGDHEGAEKCFRRASTLDPDLVDARRNLALISSTASQEIEPLEALLARPGLSDTGAMLAGFALGKLLDDAGRYDEAFARFDAANALALQINAAQGRRFDVEALRRRVDGLVHAPVRPCEAQVAPDGDLPVFVVGMPRSGTSLVEQIAASHSQVHGAGELRAIGRMASRPERVDRPEALARSHLAELRRLGGQASRVVDKMPDNAFHLDEIGRLFPHARVILCVRNARDTCLSNYFQLYTSGNVFSYRLEHCARRQVEINRLLARWRRSDALRTLVVGYENLVLDHERQCRRLIDFLGLPWEPACLKFHETHRTVTTASGWQVRQPLYARSVERWRNYARQVSGLDPILDDAAALAVQRDLEAVALTR